MYDLRLIRLLLFPSLFSGGLTVLLSALFLGYSAWSYVSEQQLFYDYLFGYSGLETYLLQQSQSLAVWQKFFLNSPAMYYALVLLAGAVAGLVAYFLLQLIGLVSHSLKEGWDSLHSQGKTARMVAIELLIHLGLRLVSLVCWCVYTGFFIGITLPFVLGLNQMGIDDVNHSELAGWLACLGALFVLTVAVHIHVIFLRLVCLRPRIFGGGLALALALAQAEAHSHDV